MRKIERVWRILKQILFERLEGLTRQIRSAVVYILISAGPQAEDLFETCWRQSGCAFNFKDDLVTAAGRWRRGHLQTRIHTGRSGLIR